MYQVIARKYRPQTFGELVSQDHVKTTIENAINQKRIAHGYIFSGQRGTGKTTVARILARCLNCVDGPTPKPCGKCSSCVEIAQGGSPDVIEIDAASNRGINEMRELRENVRYRPSRDRYKVFIIDEAHQITNEAFNALLKTLEEPPEWVVFILCTTESHKIPTTIASRCQQFSFRSVDFPELVARMRWICEQEGIATDDETLSVLAQAGEGSVRDSLSALDQAIACCGTTLTAAEVRTLLGMFGLESLASVTDALAENNPARMLEIVAELESNGRNLQHFCRELSRYLRNLLVVKIANGPTRLVAASRQEQEKLVAAAARFSEEDLTRYLQLTLDLFKDLQFSTQPRLHLEVGLVRLVHAGRLVAIEEALSRLGPGPAPVAPKGSPAGQAGSTGPGLRAAELSAASRPAAFERSVVQKPALEKPAPTAASDAPPWDAAPAARAASKPAAPAPKSEAAAAIPPDGGQPSSGDLKSAIYNTLVELGLTFTAHALVSAQVTDTPAEVQIVAKEEDLFCLEQADLDRAVKQVLGRPKRVSVKAGNPVVAAAPVAAAKKVDDEELTQRALSHPEVQRFQALFPDSQVRTIRNLKE
jgi:DNA polymerase-3 subunit gamma/tau